MNQEFLIGIIAWGIVLGGFLAFFYIGINLLVWVFRSLTSGGSSRNVSDKYSDEEYFHDSSELARRQLEEDMRRLNEDMARTEEDARRHMDDHHHHMNDHHHHHHF